MVPFALLLAKEVLRLEDSVRYGRSLRRSAFASTPIVRGLMNTVWGVTPRSVKDTDLPDVRSTSPVCS